MYGEKSDNEVLMEGGGDVFFGGPMGGVAW